MSSSEVGRLALVKDVFVVVGVERGLPSVFVVALYLGLPWAVELVSLLLFRFFVWGVDGDCASLLGLR